MLSSDADIWALVRALDGAVEVAVEAQLDVREEEEEMDDADCEDGRLRAARGAKRSAALQGWD